MKKIPTLFVRDEKTRRVTPEVTPGCEWVLAGEGIPSRKWDGTCCMIRGGRLFKRYDAKGHWLESMPPQFSYTSPPPDGFEPCGEPDYPTGHQPGWLAVGDGPEDRWHREAMVIDGSVFGEVLMCSTVEASPDGTYELCGPKIQGNPEKFRSHVLVPHGGMVWPDCPRDFEGLRAYLDGRDIEGVVFRHPDGRMAKIKGRDFGFRRPR